MYVKKKGKLLRFLFSPRCRSLPTITVTPGPLPPPSLLCPPPLGLWHLPQTEHPRGPLGTPSAQSIEVFLIVSQVEYRQSHQVAFPN